MAIILFALGFCSSCNKILQDGEKGKHAFQSLLTSCNSLPLVVAGEFCPCKLNKLEEISPNLLPFLPRDLTRLLLLERQYSRSCLLWGQPFLLREEEEEEDLFPARRAFSFTQERHKFLSSAPFPPALRLTLGQLLFNITCSSNPVYYSWSKIVCSGRLRSEICISFAQPASSQGLLNNFLKYLCTAINYFEVSFSYSLVSISNRVALFHGLIHLIVSCPCFLYNKLLYRFLCSLNRLNFANDGFSTLSNIIWSVINSFREQDDSKMSAWLTSK